MIERDKILQIMLILQPDIVAVEWSGKHDGGGLSIVRPTGEKVSFKQLESGLTRKVMVGIEMYLEHAFASPFSETIDDD